MAAAALIGLIPAVALFLLFQRYFVEGITTGAIKG
jgi:ABC-type maltose transport system permease subunit